MTRHVDKTHLGRHALHQPCVCVCVCVRARECSTSLPLLLYCEVSNTSLLPQHSLLCPPQPPGVTALIHAAFRGDVPMVKLLLHWSADISIEDMDVGGLGASGTALQMAEGKGHGDVADILRAHAAALLAQSRARTGAYQGRGLCASEDDVDSDLPARAKL